MRNSSYFGLLSCCLISSLFASVNVAAADEPVCLPPKQTSGQILVRVNPPPVEEECHLSSRSDRCRNSYPIFERLGSEFFGQGLGRMCVINFRRCKSEPAPGTGSGTGSGTGGGTGGEPPIPQARVDLQNQEPVYIPLADILSAL